MIVGGMSSIGAGKTILVIAVSFSACTAVKQTILCKAAVTMHITAIIHATRVVIRSRRPRQISQHQGLKNNEHLQQ